MAQWFPKPGIARCGVNNAITMSTATSQATAAFGAQTYIIRVATSSQPGFIRIGDGTPTAVNTDPIIGANQTEYFAVTPGQKLAVLAAGTAAPITITEMS
jgi:hypothetical protein